MQPEDEQVTCIYCKELKPPSREHLVARSIGGNLIGRRLCTACNTGTSDIDQHLADNVIVSMLRVANTPLGAFDVKLGGEQFTADAEGRRFPIAVRNEYRPEVYPMLRFTPTPAGARVGIQLSDPADARRLVKFLERHRGQSFERLHGKTVDWLEPGEAALVMHRSDDGYLAFADEPVGQRARALLREKVAELVQALGRDLPDDGGRLDRPHVQIAGELRLNDLYRAVTKLAFNLLAHRTPDEVALNDDFDEVRNYVLGKDIRDVMKEDGTIEPDPRFVTWLTEASPFVFEDMQHTVVLTEREGSSVALVSLYRHLVFLVDLGPARRSPWPHAQVLVVRGDRQETRWLELHEIYRMLRARPA